MIINTNANETVCWYNTTLDKKEAQKYCNDNNTYWVENVEIPEPQEIEGKQAVLYFSKKKGFYYQYVEQEKSEIQENEQQTDNEIIMQSLSEIELQGLEAQQQRELLAQQMTDLELAILEGGSTNV